MHWAYALLRDRLVATGLFPPGKAAEFARVRPSLAIALSPGGSNPKACGSPTRTASRCATREGDHVDHAALHRFLAALSRS